MSTDRPVVTFDKQGNPIYGDISQMDLQNGNTANAAPAAQSMPATPKKPGKTPPPMGSFDFRSFMPNSNNNSADTAKADNAEGNFTLPKPGDTELPKAESKPAPEPAPVAEPTPKPVEEPTPEPAPVEEPVPSPEPAPVEEPKPTPTPAVEELDLGSVKSEEKTNEPAVETMAEEVKSVVPVAIDTDTNFKVIPYDEFCVKYMGGWDAGLWLRKAYKYLSKGAFVLLSATERPAMRLYNVRTNSKGTVTYLLGYGDEVTCFKQEVGKPHFTDASDTVTVIDGGLQFKKETRGCAFYHSRNAKAVEL